MNEITTMVKKVNVFANIPVRTVTPAMHGRYFGIAMTPDNILKCLNARAEVEEILNDGTKIKLTRQNYNRNNNPTAADLKPKEYDTLKPAVAPEDKKAEKKIIKNEPVETPVVEESVPPVVEEKAPEVVEEPAIVPSSDLVDEDHKEIDAEAFDKVSEDLPQEEITEEHPAEVQETEQEKVEETVEETTEEQPVEEVTETEIEEAATEEATEETAEEQPVETEPVAEETTEVEASEDTVEETTASEAAEEVRGQIQPQLRKKKHH